MNYADATASESVVVVVDGCAETITPSSGSHRWVHQVAVTIDQDDEHHTDGS